MREVRRRLCLSAEALDEGAVDGQFGKEHLEGDGPVELEVHGAVDLRHTAARDEVRRFIATAIDTRGFDRLHGVPSLRWSTSGTGVGGGAHGAPPVVVDVVELEAPGTVVVEDGTVEVVVVVEVVAVPAATIWPM